MLDDFNLVLLLFFLEPAVIEGTVLYVGQNNGVEAISGSTVELVCVTDTNTGSIEWYKQDQSTVAVGETSLTFCLLGAHCFPSQKGKYEFSSSNMNQLVNIPGVNRHDERWWICVNGSNSADFYSFNLHVKFPVAAVSMNKVGNLEVPVNKPHNISCSTSYGRPAANVKFYKEINGTSAEITQTVDTSYNDGITTGTLTYRPARSDDGATIYCQANNTFTLGPVTAPDHVIIVTIEPPEGPPVIQGFANGSTYTVIENYTLELTCSIKGGKPRPSLTWICIDGSLVNEGSGDETNVKVMWTAKRNNDGPCLCVSYHPAVSTNQSVSVNVEVLYGPKQEPSIIYIHTGGQTGTLVSPFRVMENSSFSLTCNNSDGRPLPTYRWTGASSSMSGFLNVTDIKRLPSINASGISYYQYTCEIQNTMINTCGDRRHQKSTLNHNIEVDVLYPAQLDLHQNQTAVEGTEVILTATVTRHGNPMESYKWLYSETKTGEKATLANNLIHSIQNISRSEAGFYSIEATNLIHPTGLPAHYKTVSQTFWLDVFYPTTISNFTIGGQQGNITYNENDTNIEVRCHVDSNPSSDMELHSNTYLEDGKTAERESTYMIAFTIPITTCFDTGTYLCMGHNNYTRTPVSSEAHIFVRCTPRPRYLVYQNITVYKALNEPVTLNLSVIAYPEPSPEQFYWEKINGTTTTNMTNGANVNISVVNLEPRLTIYSLQQKDFGQYRLIITYNMSRFYSHYFFIHPPDKPLVPTIFTLIQDNLSATTAGFEWTPGFDGGLNQTFYVYYKKASDLLWNYTTVLRNKVTLTGLVPGTLYNVKVFAGNRIGNSSETNTLNFTTKEELVKPSPPIALIGGAAGGGAAILVIVAVVLVAIFYRRTSSFNDSQGDQTSRNPAEDDDEYYNISGVQFNRGNETYYNIGRNPYEELQHIDDHNHEYETLHSGDSNAGQVSSYGAQMKQIKLCEAQMEQVKECNAQMEQISTMSSSTGTNSK